MPFVMDIPLVIDILKQDSSTSSKSSSNEAYEISICIPEIGPVSLWFMAIRLRGIQINTSSFSSFCTEMFCWRQINKKAPHGLNKQNMNCRPVTLRSLFGLIVLPSILLQRDNRISICKVYQQLNRAARQIKPSYPGLLTYSLASCVKFLIIGVPISIALSKPVITPEEKVVHPKPIMAKTITTSRSRPNNPILQV